jgi:hypothetical protein
MDREGIEIEVFEKIQKPPRARSNEMEKPQKTQILFSFT